jgi:hypothetical protein
MKRNLSIDCFGIIKDLNFDNNELEENQIYSLRKRVKLNDMLKRKRTELGDDFYPCIKIKKNKTDKLKLNDYSIDDLISKLGCVHLAHGYHDDNHISQYTVDLQITEKKKLILVLEHFSKTNHYVYRYYISDDVEYYQPVYYEDIIPIKYQENIMNTSN